MSSAWKAVAASTISEVITENEPQNSSLNVNRFFHLPQRSSGAETSVDIGYAERLIGSIRLECLDHVVVVGERHLRHILASYQTYYGEVRTHLSPQKDAPVRVICAEQGACSSPILGGLTISMFEFEFPTGTGTTEQFGAKAQRYLAGRAVLDPERSSTQEEVA
jgi:hypothetical protein